jgi:hypothetical protein
MKKTVGLKSLSTISLTMLYPYVSCNMVMNGIFTVLDMSFNTSTLYYCYYGAMHETGVFLCLIVMTQIFLPCLKSTFIFYLQKRGTEKNYPFQTCVVTASVKQRSDDISAGCRGWFQFCVSLYCSSMQFLLLGSRLVSAPLR